MKQVLQDLLVGLVHKVQLVVKVQQDHKVLQVQLETQDHKVLQVPKEQKVLKVQQVVMVVKDKKEK